MPGCWIPVHRVQCGICRPMCPDEQPVLRRLARRVVRFQHLRASGGDWSGCGIVPRRGRTQPVSRINSASTWAFSITSDCPMRWPSPRRRSAQPNPNLPAAGSSYRRSLPGDELRLRFQRLPHVGVKRTFRDVAKSARRHSCCPAGECALRVAPRLPDATVRRDDAEQSTVPARSSPTPSSACCRTARELCRADITEQHHLGNIGIVVLNEGDFRAWDAELFQLLRHVVIDGETRSFGVDSRRTQAARNAPASTPARC